jgi:tetratricopeptide (TPR) repeat protein
MRRLLCGLVLALSAPVLFAQTDTLKNAKALFFDHKYAEARAAWTAVQKSEPAPTSDEALYWIGRCSEGLGDLERAFLEYSQFLDRKMSDPVMRNEAVTARVGIAVKLYKGGVTRHLQTALEALGNGEKTVRYFAALQLSSLGPEVGRPAVPVLREILSKESDPDLVDRAKIAILRLDPAALGNESSAPHTGKEATWLRVRITKKGEPKPEVSVNVPLALADVLFKSLPDSARAELRKKGYDADTFWARLKALGPTSVVHIEGDDGELIDIFLE